MKNGSSIDLGTLTWTPLQYTYFLWQIGTADRKADEFTLGNLPRQYGLFNQTPANLTYTIGQSMPVNDWYSEQTQVGNWTVNFNLNQTYNNTAHLTVAIAAMTRTPTVVVSVNGTNVGTLPAYANDEAIYRSATQSGYYHLVPISFPASLLQRGTNTITFQMTNAISGAGVMYDTIKLEVGDITVPTPTPTPTPKPPPGTRCQVSYVVQNQWSNGFTANITITNTSSTAINGWTLRFAFPNGQQITEGWNGSFSQQGGIVTVQNTSYNGSIAAAGGSTSIGFNASWTGNNQPPTSFTLNGAPCSTS